jgi:SAM-dependent methyltransferase
VAEPLSNEVEKREVVRNGYAAVADDVLNGVNSGCGSAGASCCGVNERSENDGPSFGIGLYDEASTQQLPEAAALASLGCGNPTAVAELQPGENVLDLGSGGGIDVLLSARRVGPSGKAYGLDMTDEMLALARENQRKAGVDNVEWLRGHIEEIPLPDRSVDVVISNCVINLSTDKQRVLREAARVLRPGGRLAIADVIADDDLEEKTRTDIQAFTSCVGGAMTRREYVTALDGAGLVEVVIAETHRVHEKASSCIVRARKPSIAKARPDLSS